ncbi:Myb-like DNA-binding domain protein, partial [Ancylostoma caninum]
MFSASWTRKETRKLLKHYKEYGMSASAIYKIGKLMGRPTHSCQNHLRSILARTGPVPDYLRRKLWIVVMKHSTKDENPFERTVRRAIYHNRHEILHTYEACTKWDIVAQRMVFSVQLVKEAWFRLLEDLQAHFNEKQQNSDSRRALWSAALKSVCSSTL